MKKNYLLIQVILAVIIGLSSCKKEDTSNINLTNNKIVGKWIDANGTKTSMSFIDCNEIPLGVITWEFTSNGYQYTNDDAICSSTYEFNNSTNELILWGGVRKVTVKWISSTEIEADIIGRLKKQ
jgi:hypothetical protein